MGRPRISMAVFTARAEARGTRKDARPTPTPNETRRRAVRFSPGLSRLWQVALGWSNLVLFEETLDALGKTSDGLALGVHHLVPVVRQSIHLDAVVLEIVLGIMVHVGRVEESLGAGRES